MFIERLLCARQCFRMISRVLWDNQKLSLTMGTGEGEAGGKPVWALKGLAGSPYR